MQMMDFREKNVLGRTGLLVSRLGVGASYGSPADSLEKAYHEHGLNFFYWGAMRRGRMGKAIRHLARTDRDKIVIALQSYDRTGFMMGPFLDRGLSSLGIDQADVLILGWRNSVPSKRVMEAALELKEAGKYRFLALSSHHRPLFGEMARLEDSPVDIFMFRYNAAHRGAERDIFPHLPGGEERPGTMAFTATCWGRLLKDRYLPEGEKPLTAPECYRFVLSNPAVDLSMIGPKDAAQMEEALQALEGGPLSPEEMERARRIGDYVYRKKK
jgi:aryl-alcohol dehydrogenase-like predicted oxidoreductase